MKINILTFVKKNSFGANLQAYALSQVLKNMGHEVKFIDFRLLPKKNSLKGKIADQISATLMQNFRNKHFPGFTKHYKTAKELIENPPGADAFIVGSDQVWNTDITQELAPNFFLDFVPDDKLKIAYAASFGKESFDYPYTARIKNLLGKFDAISLREIAGTNILKYEFNMKSEVVLDPTLLLDDYSQICKPQKVNKQELVSFKFVKNDIYYRDLDKLAKVTSLKPVNLNFRKPVKGFIYRPFCSMKQWLNSIANSSLVVTDSFHCMAFAIIFQKNFIALSGKPERISRLTNLLKKLGIENRFYNRIEEAINKGMHNENINYQRVNQILNAERKNSLKFLINALSE
jgi:hypothetical protein